MCARINSFTISDILLVNVSSGGFGIKVSFIRYWRTIIQNSNYQTGQSTFECHDHTYIYIFHELKLAKCNS